jgi:hypothetical protein
MIPWILNNIVCIHTALSQVKMAIFLDVTPCIIVGYVDVWEEHTTSIISIEDRDTFLRNVGIR